MAAHKGTQTLETPRLILRQARVEDAEAMYENWARDPAVTEFLTWPPHKSQEITRWVLETWVKSYEQADYYQWMIVPKDGGDRPIGTISVVSQSDQIGKAEVGYCIGKPWWHQGLMTEAMKAVVAFLFTQVGMNRVEAKHDARNPHSGGVMGKAGLHLEGRSPQAGWNNQGVCDLVFYGLTREDWERET